MRRAPLTDPDRRLVSRTWRRIAVQTAAVFTVGIVTLGGLSALLVVQVQRAVTNHQMQQAITSNGDDLPPAGAWVYRYDRETGEARLDEPSHDGDRSGPVSPGRPATALDLAGLRAVAAGAADRTVEVQRGDREYLVRTGRHDGEAIQVAMDLTYQERERHQLYASLASASALGLVLSVLVGALIARRAIAPLGLALSRQRRFVADASHELRTPLTQLHTRAQLLDRQLRGGADPTELADDTRQLVRNTRELGELVEDLLLTAQQRAEPPRTPVDLAVTAADAVAAESARAADRGVEITLSDDGAQYLVLGNAPALRRVLTSLLDNALGHTPSGGRVEVSLRRLSRSGDVVVAVADTGVGFDPADAERMFERFARGSHGAGRRFGLGLALVREVVDAHGGTVSATGEPGRGATFSVQLPAAPDS